VQDAVNGKSDKNHQVRQPVQESFAGCPLAVGALRALDEEEQQNRAEKLHPEKILLRHNPNQEANQPQKRPKPIARGPGGVFECFCHAQERQEVEGQEDVRESVHNREPVESKTRIDREEHRRPHPKLLLFREEFIQELPEGAGGYPAHDEGENGPARSGFAEDCHQRYVGVRKEGAVFGEIEQESFVAQFLFKENDIPVVQIKALSERQQPVCQDGEQQQQKRKPELAREGVNAGDGRSADGVVVHQG